MDKNFIAYMLYRPDNLILRSSREREIHSVVSDPAIPWTVAHEAPLSVGYSRQDCRKGLPFPSPGDLPDLGIALQADSLLSELQVHHSDHLDLFYYKYK